jgi:serine phosphatase RsbU (regulator of sigma subunit)
MQDNRTKLNPFFSLKTQLVVGAVALLAVTISLISYSLVLQEKRILTSEIEKTIILQGRNIALSSEKALLRSDPEFELFPRIKRILSHSENIKSVVITDSDGLIQGDKELTNLSKPYNPDLSKFAAKISSLLVADESLYDTKNSFIFKTPVKGMGKVVGHVHLEYSKIDLQRSMQRAITVTFICGVIAFGLGIILALVLFRRISDPVDTLVRGAKRIGAGNLDTKIELHTRNEFSVLADSFNEMAARISRTQDELIAKERMERELEIAHDIQSTLIPTQSYTTEGFEISFYYKAAMQVGGDYVDTFPIDDRNIALVMGDVSGKGVPGLVVMAMLKIMVRALTTKQLSPREVVRRLNISLAENLKPKMFVTFFVAYLNLDTSEITYSNAGHNPLVIYRRSNNMCDLHKMEGAPLGVFKDETYAPLLSEYRLTLEEGDLIFQYTDGLNESANPQGDQFDFDNILDVSGRFATEGAMALVQRMIVFEEVFRKGAPQMDDITLLALSSTEPVPAAGAADNPQKATVES